MNKKKIFDIFIIGGGINGCGIARDASGRGLQVCLAEMGDIGSGTSSASTKLIHGGLRYLKYFDYKLKYDRLEDFIDDLFDRIETDEESLEENGYSIDIMGDTAASHLITFSKNDMLYINRTLKCKQPHNNLSSSQQIISSNLSSYQWLS